MPYAAGAETIFTRYGTVSEQVAQGRRSPAVHGPFPDAIGSRLGPMRVISLKKEAVAYRDEP